MLSFIGMLAAVLITLVIAGGFVAIAFIFIFELGALVTFWLKHSLNEPRAGEEAPTSY